MLPAIRDARDVVSHATCAKSLAGGNLPRRLRVLANRTAYGAVSRSVNGCQGAIRTPSTARSNHMCSGDTQTPKRGGAVTRDSGPPWPASWRWRPTGFSPPGPDRMTRAPLKLPGTTSGILHRPPYNPVTPWAGLRPGAKPADNKTVADPVSRVSESIPHAPSFTPGPRTMGSVTGG